MEERGTPRSQRSAKAALLATLTAALVLTPIFWFIGVLHFGFITGPDPRVDRMVSYFAWTSLSGVLLFAYILRRYVHKLSWRELRYGRACAVAAVALAPLQAATWQVTLTQWGHDELVVLSALMLALTAAVFLTERLSEASRVVVKGP
jgi:peptidoglycan/LPS O-acetylase OafA/YrhL